VSRRIFMQHLPFSLEEELLAVAITDVLSKFGTVRSLTCLCEGSQIRPKNLWFAEMETDWEAAQAIENLDGLRIAGRKLRVGEARPVLAQRQREISAPLGRKPEKRRYS
jgi:RNA recognition motif-containing protein